MPSYPTNTRLVPQKIEFTTRTLATQFQSPYTGKSQTHRYGGQFWELNVTLAPLFLDDALELTAFLNSLAGTSTAFTFKLPSKFMIPSSVTFDTTTTGNDFTLTAGTVSVGKYGYTTNYTANRLVQFTTGTSVFPKLKPSQAGYTVNNSAGANMRLVNNDVQYSVDEMMLTGIVIPMVESFT
jgi:hypothetical protein